MQLPEATAARLVDDFATNRLNAENIHRFDVRVDHELSTNDHVFVRCSFGKTTRVKPGQPGGASSQGDEDGNTHGLALSYTKMLSNSLVNEARFVGREVINRLQPLGSDTSDIPASFGIKGTPQVDGNGGLPLIFMGDLRQFGAVDWLVAERLGDTLQLGARTSRRVSWHSFKRASWPRRSSCPGPVHPGRRAVSTMSTFSPPSPTARTSAPDAPSSCSRRSIHGAGRCGHVGRGQPGAGLPVR